MVCFSSNFSYAHVYQTPIHTIFLVRHAERAVSDDLTDKGRVRAIYLAKMLRDESISKLYSTDYNRTQLTITPTSIDQHVPITTYDSNQDLLGLLEHDFKQKNAQTMVIVGHRNTLAELIFELGGPALEDIPETEFDNLFVITKSEENVGFVRLHY
jgi:2,3-bisphosphoglycerate-dependent phosphoglycerate mutase